MSKIGDVEFSIVNEENVTYRNLISSKPIESKEDISEHIIHQPYKATLEFYIIGDDATDKKRDLEEMAHKTEVYQYFDAKELETHDNIAIQELSWANNKRVNNGFRGRMTIKKIKIVKGELVGVQTGTDPASGETTDEQNSVQDKAADDETKPVSTEVPKNIPGEGAEGEVESSLLYDLIYGSGD